MVVQTRWIVASVGTLCDPVTGRYRAASAAHSTIAVNVRDPATTAHTTSASTSHNGYRRPPLRTRCGNFISERGLRTRRVDDNQATSQTKGQTSVRPFL